jgi:DNA recombination protein RmuC
MAAMNAATVIALLVVFAAGLALGWLLHAARVGDRTALRDNERLLRESVAIVSEDAARRHSGAIGSQVGALVEPLHAALTALSDNVAALERHRAQAYAGLREQVAGMAKTSALLSSQTSQLVAALRAPAVRGRWGEIQLERVVELAGMTRHCDFDTQVTAAGVRPDLVVRLAGGRHIVVDAKVPFEGYLDATGTDDPDEQAAHLARHARQLREHIDQLASKAYWAAFEPSPEFVVLFLPGDPFLDAALATDARLLEHAFGKNVILATPTTLVAMLRTIAHMWRQEAVTRDVATIQQLGRQLYTRLSGVARGLDRLGTQLAKAVDTFNTTTASIESRVLVTARKLHELDLVEAPMPEIRQVDTRPRAVGLAIAGTDNGQVNDTEG